MIPAAGPVLDGIVARRLGEPGPAPGYSTDPAAADRLIAHLEKSGILFLGESVDGTWYCALSVEIGWARERLATGSGETRELALCRAVSHLPPWVRPAGPDRREPLAPETDGPAALEADPPPRREEMTEAREGASACAECGAPLARSQSLLCSVCSYRQGRQARVEFEARRRLRRRRPPAAG